MKKIRVCARVIPSTLSRGIHRVGNALENHAPDWVTLVHDPTEADVWILHVIGHGSMEQVPTYPGDIAMIQYCLRTSEDPSPYAWLPYWSRARAVWSYYDLNRYIDEWPEIRDDPNQAGTRALWSQCRFIHAPLGVNGRVFRPSVPVRKRFIVGTSGYIADTEGVHECYDAAKHHGKFLFHLGPNLNLGPGVVQVHNIDDESVASFWGMCTYVAGLRRIEGFELPALEGLACGARPICFDQPHYKAWFREHAEYVPEVGREELTQHLIELFAKPARAVSEAERKQVLWMFDWKKLAEEFWEALR